MTPTRTLVTNSHNRRKRDNSAPRRCHPCVQCVFLRLIERALGNTNEFSISLMIQEHSGLSQMAAGRHSELWSERSGRVLCSEPSARRPREKEYGRCPTWTITE